jgi:zinc transporter ZupT
MLPVLLGLILAVAHYFSERIEPRDPAIKHKVVSFIAGISITYIFLLLLPEVYEGIESLSNFLFLFILAGFAGFHLIEKHIYQHRSKEILQEQLRTAHSTTFFIYHFVIGILLVELVSINVLSGVLFFIPILFHTAVSSASLKGIHVSIRERMILKLVLSLSTLFGVLLAYSLMIPSNILHALLGFIVGSLLYIVIKDSIPRETEGKAAYFVLGIIIYAIIIGFSWMV